MSLKASSKADTQIREILKNESPGSMLRAFVIGAGCSGITFGFSVESEPNEDDIAIDLQGYFILVDHWSIAYLRNATIEYEESLHGAHFTIDSSDGLGSCNGCSSATV